MKNTNYTYIVIGIVLVLLIVAGVWGYLKDERIVTPQVDTLVPAATTDTSATSIAEQVPVKAPAKTGVHLSNTSALLDYQQAIAKYGDHRIQIDNCVATPAYVTFKNGAQLMLDNRSPDGQELILDGKSYRIWGYEYAVAKLTATKFPHTILMDCIVNDTLQPNIMTIVLQP